MAKQQVKVCKTDMLLEIYELYQPIAKVLNDLSEVRVTAEKP